MSNIYIQEPPSNGKVLVKTTVGDIDIELWSKEAPKACRNFVQLCLEGYYDGTSFHRVVKDFIVQGGDPTDTGEGGESVYGAPFKDEFHTRLRFVRRGLVAMANAGPHDNGSQFFFTMGTTPELMNKHTIFGKVVGDTLYNMLKLQEVEVDEASERPTDPHKIISTEVLNNPFEDIVPRQLKRPKNKDEEKKVKSKSKATKNFSLLSFGDEAEDDEEQVDKATESFRGKSKSSHDLTDDPRLSSVPAVDKDRAAAAEAEKLKNLAEGSPDDKARKREGEEKNTDGEEEETAEKVESQKDETVKKKSNSPEDSKKQKLDSPEETKKPKMETKPEVKRKSRFEPLESEKKKSPEPVKTSSTPEDSDAKKRKPEAESDSKKTVKEEVREEGRKKKQEPEPSQDSKKRKSDDPHKDEGKKRSKEAEDEEKKKRRGEGKEEEGRKKRKGEEVKEEGKKKVKTEAVNSPKPTEKDKNPKDDTRQKVKKEKEVESPRGKETKSLLGFVEEDKQNRMDDIKKEQRKLQRDIKDSKKRVTTEDKPKVKVEDEDEADEKKDPDTEENDLLAVVKKERMKYKQRKKQLGRKEDREAATLAMLAKFQNKLTTARTLAGDYDDDPPEEKKAEEEAEDDDDDMSWLRHKLIFEDAATKAKVIDANISDLDRYTLVDPRNPLNQRRRETSKRAMKDKR